MEKPIIAEDKILLVDPITIKVKEELPRLRKDLGKIAEMAVSLERFGQLQPIVVNREMELIAGGRRLAACILAQREVKICFVDEVDPLRMREMELEENIQRKALTPSEEVLATAELHQLKVSLYGEAKPGIKDETTTQWTQQNTADLLGKSRTSIIEDLILAEAVKNFPSLSTAKTKSEIKSAVKGLERVAKNMDALSKYEETIKQTKEFVLVNRDAVEHMKGIPSESIDLLLTDPPYGLDIHELAMGLGGDTGGELTTSGIKYEDSEEYAKGLLKELATQSFRFTKPTGHFYSFCAPSHFWWFLQELRFAGWIVRERPIVWIKRESGQNNQPSYWPSSAYEQGRQIPG
jgi:ParB/RepB/Spo0J family partition protein